MMKTIFSLFIKGMFVLLSVVAGSLYAAEPGGVASPKWWGQASGLAGADGSQISTWTNSSTTNVGQNAVQGTATARPLLRNNIAKRVNFNPVAQFDGSNDVLSVSAGFSGASTHQRAHYFMVVVPSNSTQQSWAFWETQVNFPVDADGRLAVHLPWLNTIYWDAGTCCANNRLSYTPSVPYVLTPTVWSFVKDTAPPSGMLKQEISRNAQVEATRASTTAFTGNNSAFNVGSGPGSGFFAGDIAEGLLYIDTIIDTTARLKVDSYLAIKYGITLGGPIGTATNYLSSTAATWWTGTAAYQFNIAGIAKDSTSALDQRISRSTNTAMAQISIAAGSSFPSGTITAQSPADSITNLDAFVWGDNNVSSTDSNSFFNIASGTQKGAQLSGRIWRAQRTGGSIGNVTLCIPDSLTPSTWQTPYLYAASDAGFTASVTITALGPSTAAVCPDVHGGSALVAGRRVTVNAANLAPSGGVGFFTIGQPVVSGTIFEDITGNLVAADGDANLSDTAGDQRRLQGVTVRLFYDINGNGNIGGGDPYIATATTNANGTYFLPTHLDTANYLVVVERPTTNAAGTTGLLAEQTYGSGNTIAVGTTKAIRALCETGAGATAQKTTNGACYGGRNGATADGNVGTTNAPNREHVTLVSVVSGNSVANVDSGFSFNVVTNLNDTGQGSLRQFIANANAIIGANAMRFVPAVPTNQTSGANTWWRITPTTALPAITVTNGNNTTIDGRAYNLADGVTQLQTNTASIGSTLSVGTGVDARVGTGDEYAMSSLNGPELEVNWATPASSFILQAQAASTTIQNVCLNNPTANANTAIIQVTNAASNSIIQNNVLGSSCGNNTLDGTGSPTNASNSGIVAFENSTGVTISGNKIGNRALGLAQLTTAGAANNATIRGNEVYNDTGASSGINLGVGTNNLGLAGASVIRDNYLWGIAGRGFVDDANSIYSFLNNTVLRGARVGATIATTQLRVLQNNIFYNNTDAGTQGQGVVVGGSGVAVATNSVQITQNSFLNNQGNAIDLGGGGVNVPTSSCAGGGANANNSLARPNITSADLLGTTLTMSGTYCNTGTFTLEFYKAVGSCATGDCDGTATPRVAGEGQTYLGRLTGLTGGTFTNQNMTIPSGILAYGDSISVIAIRTAGTAIGDTSEFSINYTLRNISGIVFEDVTGNALTDGDVVLDDASGDQQGRGGVTVCAFKDNGDAIPNASDSLILCTQTASSGSIGAYQFPAGGLVTGKYWIAVQASQIIPSAGGTGLAEQTYAGVGTAAAGITSRNVRCVGAPTTYSANQQQTTSGACYGGKTGDVADGFVGTLLSLANAEHIAELNIDASQIAQLTDLNFGFSFNVVTNTNDTGQGSLRQFVNNANTVTGANAMRFVPAVVTNASGSGQTWWRTTVNTVLPTITGVNATNTTVDGTAYSNTDGITVVETNTANIGSNVTVGTNALPLWVTPMPAPELELTGNTAVVINDGFVVDAGNVTIRRMAIQGFSNAVDGGTESLIRVGTSSASSFTNTLIEENVIGNNPIVSLPRYTGGNGVAITGADNGIIRRNIIARTGDCLIVIGLAGDPCAISGGSATLDNVDNWQILNNELFDAVGHGGLYSAAISIKNAVGASPRTLTIAQNYIHDNITGGIATSDIDTGRYAISNNTITGNAVALSPRMGVRMGTTGVSQVFDNVIKNNQGPGLWITGAGRNINAGRNIYGGNTGNAVDLSASTSADGVTLNNTSCLNQNGASSGNAGAARPVITSASLVGTTLTVSGTYCSTLDPFAVIEIYEAVGAGTQNGSANNDYGSDNQMAGEGIQFLGHGIGSAGTFTASLDVTGKGLTVNSLISAIVGGGGTLNIATEFSANIGLLGLSGVVYEDVNYGGGAGRDLATSSGVGRDSVRVELYKETSAGSGVYTYVSSTTTSTLSGQAGSYQFGGLMAANYRVRVVNNTTDRVSSSRAGDDSSVYGVQTYRTDASTGSAVAVSNEIGGRTPAFTADAANVTTVGGAFPDGGSSGTQTLYWAPVALSSAAVTGVDFGFNFDTIVNVADCANPSATVQCLGSLRQFVNNANLLSNTGLAQALPGAIASDYTTGDEVSIFMVPTAALSSGVAKVQLTSILPQVTGANAASTKLDGRTQTYNTTTSTGDTNSGMLGAGGVVGVDGLTLSQVNRPEVEITAQTPNLAIGLNTNAANVAVRGLSIWGFDTFVLVYDANNFIAQQNVLGSSATAFTAPAILPTQAGIQFPNAATGSNVLIENNLIGFTGLNGLYVGRGAVTNWTIRNNEFRRNGISPTAQSGLGEGIFIENFGNLSMLIEGNLLQQNDQQAVELDYGSGLTIRNNSLIANGARPQEQAQIFFYQASNSTISKNIIRDGFQDGILLTNNAATVTVSQNSIYNNTGLGINLVADYLEPNTGFIPTLNDANDADTGANGFLNFPIIQSAVLAGSNLIVSGCAPAGAIIELFEADVSPGGAATLGANTFTPRTLDYGEGQTYLSSITEGSAGDTDSGTCSSPIDDLDGNDQTGMNKFSFSIPIPSGIVSDDLLTATSTLANATSEFSPIAMVRSNDYGDAPLSYGQVGHAVIGPILGTLRDVDSSYPAAPGLLADADDTTGVDDEDALSTLPLVHAGMIGITNGYSLTIPVSNITANTNLCAWLDFNRDGTFASIEGVCSVLSSGTSSATLNFTVPNTLKVGDLYARLRITTNALSTADGGNTAAFTDGEVEDYYRADGIKPVVRINKTLSPATAGDLFKLEVTGGNATPASGASNPATNIGNGGSTGWIMVDQASSLTLAEHQWMSRPLTAFSTTINCTEGDGTTPHLVNSPSLAGAVMRSAILTAPATGAEGTAAQRICTFINVEPSVYSITGRVFTDTGAGNANDALQNGAEAGLSGVTVKLTNCSGTIYASTTTNSLGDYSFDASLAPAGTTCIEQTNLSGYLSTGANQSNTLLPDGTPTSVSGTSYTYTRSIDRIQFNLVSATSYTGLNFADIPASTLQPNGANTVLAGAIATYAHTFVAGSAGSVTFSASNTASPANPAWAHSLFADNDCNGILDLSAGDTPLTLTQSVTAGQTICILVRQNTPAGANIGDSNTITLGATINYTGAAPALGQTLTRTDLTTITNSTLVLQKQVRNLTQGGAWGNSNQAKSGDVLEYKISYTNTGSQALNTLQVNDATPAFTTFASAVCGSPLPASLSACVVSAQPTVGGVGAITWSFTGSLAPNGTVGEVTYQVTVQ